MARASEAGVVVEGGAGCSLRPNPRPGAHEAPAQTAPPPPRPRFLLSIVGVIAVPALIPLAKIRQPRSPVLIPPNSIDNPSPLGYTWSLLLFVVPCAVLGWWLHRRHRGPFERKSFWVT